MTKDPLKKRKYPAKTEENKIAAANAKWAATPGDRKKKGPPDYWQALNKRRPFDYEDLL